MWSIKSDVLRNDTLSNLNIKHFITTRKLGNMLDDLMLREVLSRNNIPTDSLVTAEQVHGNRVHIVRTEDRGKKNPGVDGLIAESEGFALGIFTADCVPLFVVDKSTKKIGLIHSGWKSLQKGIIENFMEMFGAKPENIVVVIAPHICDKCYRVGEPFREYFPDNYRDGNMNLQNEIMRRLIAQKIIERNIDTIDLNRFCTCHNNDLFFFLSPG
ncbi:MAG: hypothetical protein COS17_05360 [Elusimicrobia bacterium CG02_land_8_20_14_3_00_37_13]|nr:MAG: hypothetical protein COS17_05360 [Elusimicrobia bacterium CG02_land_8_20_14_3_00_37_13]